MERELNDDSGYLFIYSMLTVNSKLNVYKEKKLKIKFQK